MIKITKKGNANKRDNTTKKFVCGTCGCEFQATEEHWKDISQYYGPIVYGVRCPECNSLAKEKVEV
jgi:DNA-directed RNA polymerase subunit RPC12/RpoP